jgi:hypothetical protein
MHTLSFVFNFIIAFGYTVSFAIVMNTLFNTICGKHYFIRTRYKYPTFVNAPYNGYTAPDSKNILIKEISDQLKKKKIKFKFEKVYECDYDIANGTLYHVYTLRFKHEKDRLAYQLKNG